MARSIANTKKEGNSPSHRQRRLTIRRITTRTVLPLAFAVLLVLPSVYAARPARADNPFDAYITIQNPTNLTFTGISGNLDGGFGSNGSHWVQPAQQCGSGVFVPNQPDGSPPNLLGPGQSICVQSESNSGWWPSGTGGNITIPSAGSLSWSVPYGASLGIADPGDNCNANTSQEPGSSFPKATVSGGWDGTVGRLGLFQGGECPFAFGLTKPAPLSKPTNSLHAGQALSNGVVGSYITATGRNGIPYRMLVGDGNLIVVRGNFPGDPIPIIPVWSSGTNNGQVAFFGGENGNLMLIDAAGSIVWQSNTGCEGFTFGPCQVKNPGAYVSPVGSDLVSDTLVPVVQSSNGTPLWSGRSCSDACSPE